jgi:hypothetical protein
MRTRSAKARKRNAWLANQQKQSSFRRHFFRVSYHAPLFFLLFSTLRARAASEREREIERERALHQDTAATREGRKETRKEGCAFFSPSLAMTVFCKEWSLKEEKVSSAHYHSTSASL